MTAIELRDVVKVFPGKPRVVALRGVDLDVAGGSIVAVLGPSGCGKTTLLRLVAGFERPDRGTVSFDGRLVASASMSVPPEKRRVGIVPQEGALFPHLTVAGNIAFGLGRRTRRDRRAARARVGELLELVGLEGYERRRPQELSGGQQQRVAVARALAGRPAVVLLDEPFAALDVALRSRLRHDVADVLRAAGTTALLVTHDPAEALTMGDVVAVMHEGAILQQGPSQDVYQRPASVLVARMLGETVVLVGRAHGCVADSVLGPVRLRAPQDAREVQLLLRPEQIVLDPTSSCRATVERIRYQGHDALVELAVGGAEVVARWASVDLPPVHTEVAVRVVGDVGVVPDPADAAAVGQPTPFRVSTAAIRSPML